MNDTKSKQSATNLEQLKDHVRMLQLLLDDPHPGLASWVHFYGVQMQAISDFWNKPSN